MNTGSISSIPTERVRAARQPKRPLSRYFFFRHMYMHRRLVSRKRLSVMQEYAAGEQAKQGGREKGGPPVRIQREKLIGRNGGAYSAEGGDEHSSTKGAAPGEKGEYSY